MSKEPIERKWIQEMIEKLMDINTDYKEVLKKRNVSRTVSLRRKLQEFKVICTDFREDTFNEITDIEKPKQS